MCIIFPNHQHHELPQGQQCQQVHLSRLSPNNTPFTQRGDKTAKLPPKVANTYLFLAFPTLNSSTCLNAAYVAIFL